MGRNRRRRPARRAKRQSTPPARRAVARTLIGALAALVLTTLVALGWLVIVYPKRPGPGQGRERRVEVQPGMDIDRLARRLATDGVVENPRIFAIYARLLGADEHLRREAVLLTDDMSPRDVLQRLSVGFGSATVRVTIPEGFHRFSVGERLERWGVCDADDFVAASEDPALLEELGIEGPSAEGYLFPDTYRLPQDLAAPDVVRRLVANWHRRVDPVLERRAAGLAELEETLSWGAHEVLILASIVEKEAAVHEERPVIARVFLNRLRDPEFRPKRLQADPTVSYGCLASSDAPSCARFDGRSITRAMLGDRANPYNTYRHEHLPPGPICNPGVASIEAVLESEDNGYLYFVARGAGRHAFSSTLEEHNAAVARYRQRH